MIHLSESLARLPNIPHIITVNSALIGEMLSITLRSYTLRVNNAVSPQWNYASIEYAEFPF